MDASAKRREPSVKPHAPATASPSPRPPSSRSPPPGPRSCPGTAASPGRRGPCTTPPSRGPGRITNQPPEQRRDHGSVARKISITPLQQPGSACSTPNLLVLPPLQRLRIQRPERDPPLLRSASSCPSTCASGRAGRTCRSGTPGMTTATMKPPSSSRPGPRRLGCKPTVTTLITWQTAKAISRVRSGQPASQVRSIGAKVFGTLRPAARSQPQRSQFGASSAGRRASHSGQRGTGLPPMTVYGLPSSSVVPAEERYGAGFAVAAASGGRSVEAIRSRGRGRHRVRERPAARGAAEGGRGHHETERPIPKGTGMPNRQAIVFVIRYSFVLGSSSFVILISS